MNPTLGTILLCILGFGLITGIILLIYSFLEASNLKIDIQDIYPSTRTSEKKEDSSSKASAPGSIVTIGFFSDSHGRFCHFKPNRVYSEFIKHNCDLVLFGGDCCLHHHVTPTDLPMLRETAKALKEKNIDLYAIYGNHDSKMEDHFYEDMGVILLRDNWREININGTKFALCGLYDSGRENRVWPKIPKDFSDYEGFRLLLVHNPDFIYSLPDYTGRTDLPFDYQLSGHLHGGQVHLPFTLEYKLLRYDKIALEENILGGPFTFRGLTGLISKGVGCGALPIRFRARPEIHILKFHI
ncbi:MAG: metallophosphoesterase family protein [Clostridiales bacterium]|nr:metallophosphoesterase family protein [Clostridiales bacterium]